ncbi:TetR/AcrR family transcriptional regulator [Bacillaceae bacterium SIJ1]|uniref:TetR/AcrR family transcriptional regulator n=1 Tax=Litoribacterium kuwaitense TaxID=1398745 RepID=UPI0013E9F30E|nr:TetR/AcrR family transcriptional regulator [Litoribacterium kuwaitense]NGP45636.1 TetR/AcrR family transcriptional regulator [Litoribacterium kuwaitense]
MEETKVDPRVQRTRRLIMDAFIELSGEKEFRDITVKDITTEAMINRATFYYHFADIYDLLEKALSEVLLVNLNGADFADRALNAETLTAMFVAITNFQKSLSNRCHRGYEETIARIIREQLEVILFDILKRQYSDDEEALNTLAVVLSWGLYGASVKWKQESTLQPEAYIQSVLPFLTKGIGSDH